jgi:hypothetical protein
MVSTKESPVARAMRFVGIGKGKNKEQPEIAPAAPVTPTIVRQKRKARAKKVVAPKRRGRPPKTEKTVKKTPTNGKRSYERVPAAVSAIDPRSIVFMRVKPENIGVLKAGDELVRIDDADQTFVVRAHPTEPGKFVERRSKIYNVLARYRKSMPKAKAVKGFRKGRKVHAK